ncbi:D-amino acid oxidase, partial [Micromonospora sp. M42]|uniref:FAD-dependent oxidoreductase n=1 Tax=Micromonospora sp. M42 TaxID=457406 RepID=UPI0003EEE120
MTEADVVVVGGGVVGLTTALTLQRRGARVTVLTAHDPADTVSTVAAAVWYPSHTDEDPRVLRWARDTHAELRRQAADGVPFCGRLCPPGCGFFYRYAGPPWWADACGDLVVEPAEPPYTALLRFTAPSVEMTPYLTWLRERLESGGGRVVRRGWARSPTRTRSRRSWSTRPVWPPGGSPPTRPCTRRAGTSCWWRTLDLTVSGSRRGRPRAGITYVHP